MAGDGGFAAQHIQSPTVTIQHIVGWEPVPLLDPQILRLMMQIVTTAPTATFAPQMTKSSLLGGL